MFVQEVVRDLHTDVCNYSFCVSFSGHTEHLLYVNSMQHHPACLQLFFVFTFSFLRKWDSMRMTKLLFYQLSLYLLYRRGNFVDSGRMFIELRCSWCYNNYTFWRLLRLRSTIWRLEWQNKDTVALVYILCNWHRHLQLTHTYVVKYLNWFSFRNVTEKIGRFSAYFNVFGILD